jgi:hypothetical protein
MRSVFPALQKQIEPRNKFGLNLVGGPCWLSALGNQLSAEINLRMKVSKIRGVMQLIESMRPAQWIWRWNRPSPRAVQ